MRFEDLTQDNIDLLGQIYRNLIDGGLMLAVVSYDEFVDCVLNRGDYSRIEEETKNV
jgi:hypothetical protein